MKSNYIRVFVILGLVCLFVSFTNDNKVHLKLSEIAQEYLTYSLFYNKTKIVFDSTLYKWAVEDCYLPPDSARGICTRVDSISISKANSEVCIHGKKIYRLFVKNLDRYKSSLLMEQPFDQCLVKETWETIQIEYDSNNKKLLQIQDEPTKKWFTIGKKSSLFIMYKEAEMSTNDNGWVYGGVEFNNDKLVITIQNSQNRNSCIGCHSSSKYDRILGIHK